MSILNSEIIRRFNESENRIDLDENILFNYIKLDGFNERLLSADLRIDYNFNYGLILEAFQHSKLTKNKSDKIFLEGSLPDNIKIEIETILFGNYSSLKSLYNYETFAITDVGGFDFYFNIDNVTTNIGIEGGLPKEYFETEIEESLYSLNQTLANWIEEKYMNWLI